MTRPLPFERVAVLGMGLMGGSLARALRSLPQPPRLVGWSPETGEAERARVAGALDEVTLDPDAAARSGDLVVYATPLGAVLELMDRHRHLWREEGVITDVASLKAPVLERASALGAASRYVGSHPMVGGEGSGFAASRADLYLGARVWLVSGSGSDAARRGVEGLWRALGARPEWTDPGEHDRSMVQTSQLPQLLSNALARALEQAGVPRSELGPGGRDMTRLAGSSPGMWHDLLAHSAPLLASALREVGGTLEELAELLDAGKVEELVRIMEETRRWTGVGDGRGAGRHP